MKITWYGHSCFKVESAGGSVVFDPYAPGKVPGMELPDITADAVLCSHGHADHNYAEGITLTGKTPTFTVRALDSWHDEQSGALRGPNTVSVLEDEGLRLVHMGDIGHIPMEELAEKIGKADILMVPVGGYYTVDAKAAKEICSLLSAEFILPMHCRIGKTDYDVIAPIEDFLRLFDGKDIQYLDSDTADVKELTGRVVLFRLGGAPKRKGLFPDEKFAGIREKFIEVL